MATAMGPRPAIVVDGRISRVGRRMSVRIFYSAPITGGIYGAPRTFHVDDILRGGWSLEDRKRAALMTP